MTQIINEVGAPRVMLEVKLTKLDLTLVVGGPTAAYL